MLPRILAFFCAAIVLAQPPQWNLPDSVTPLSYSIELRIDPSLPLFSGLVRIDVELKTASRMIWLNGRDLTVKRVRVQFGSATQTGSAQLAGGEFIGLRLPKSIGPGNATLWIEYSAPLSEKAKSGPYRRQTDGDWYAFTVFTPIEARRAFPCFDEPRFKTPWNLAIRTKSADGAFANAPEQGVSEQSDGTKIHYFAPTQKIPAEVVAFAVGPFDVYDGGRAGKHDTPVRVLTPRGHAAEGKAAAEATRRVLPRLEAFTGIAYPWAKLDHVALPEGAFGAVENPGLITYLSRSLLPPADAPVERILGLQGLEAHELAHQWFGNLVTQATWDDVWLSEGFATWFSAEAMDEDEPPARHHLHFVARRARIMEADDGPRSHAVRNPKHTRAEMASVYDQFPYQKGAAILLTLESWLGKEKLRAGLREYLRQHAMGNATSADLADELNKASGLDVRPVIDSLLDHKNVPVVEGRLDCARKQAVLMQPVDRVQMIPVCYRSDAGSACVVSQKASVDIPLDSCPRWIFWNSGGMGYFRTLWRSADRVPPLTSLSATERLTLALDLRWSIRSGALKAEAVALVLKALEADAEPEVAAAAKPPAEAK